MTTPTPGPNDARLLAHEPPVPADRYRPALWAPLARWLAARRRVLSMAASLPPEAWEAASACPGWSRQDVLAHLASLDAPCQDALRAVLDGRNASAAAVNVATKVDAWNAAQVRARRGRSVAALAADLDAGLAETLELLARVREDQLGRRCGASPNVPASLEARVRHEQAHADDIVNGPQMLR